MRAFSIMLTTCAAVICLGAFAFRNVSPGLDKEEGIRIVRRSDNRVRIASVGASGTAIGSLEGVDPPNPAHASEALPHYGAPSEKPDPLLDGAMAQAPDDIAVRHRLLAMQLSSGNDPSAEREIATRLAARWGAQPSLIRVACSVSVCEIATDLPRLASQVASDAAAFSTDSVASCLSPDALPSWTNGTVAVRYVGRTGC